MGMRDAASAASQSALERGYISGDMRAYGLYRRRQTKTGRDSQGNGDNVPDDLRAWRIHTRSVLLYDDRFFPERACGYKRRKRFCVGSARRLRHRGSSDTAVLGVCGKQAVAGAGKERCGDKQWRQGGKTFGAVRHRKFADRPYMRGAGKRCGIGLRTEAHRLVREMLVSFDTVLRNRQREGTDTCRKI